MKIEKHPEFTPVTITLESQEEVDALFGLCSYIPIIGIHPLYSQIYLEMENYSTKESHKYYLAVDKTIKRR